MAAAVNIIMSVWLTVHGKGLVVANNLLRKHHEDTWSQGGGLGLTLKAASTEGRDAWPGASVSAWNASCT